jgi:hypothetical protein
MDFTKNYVLTDEQVQNLIKNKIINPFVPKGVDGMTPIYVLKQEDIKLIGEGGLGSGKPLKLSKEEYKIRRKEQMKNAQRVYREKNRADYNKKQNEYYYAMKEDDEKYKNWKKKMEKVNQDYRSKKKLQTGDKKKIRRVEREIKEEWKQMNKGKAGRPKKGEEKIKKEIDKVWFEAEKQKRIQKLTENLGKEFVIPKTPYVYTKKDVEEAEKLGKKGVKEGDKKFDTEGRQVYKKFEIDLKKEPIYPYLGDKDYNYEKSGFAPPENPTPYTDADYLEYKATKLIPKSLKKDIKKKKKENIELVIEEKPVKEKKVKEEPIVYKGKTPSELNEQERKAYDYIVKKNLDPRNKGNQISFSYITDLMKILE